MSLSDAVALLELAGQTVTVEELQAAIAAGFPANPDGTISLQRYGAWLLNNKEDESDTSPLG